MKWLLLTAAVLLGLAVVVTLIGAALPKEHAASRQATLPVPPAVVWSVVTDPERFPEWRSDVSRVERLPDRNGMPAWVEHGSTGRIPFAVERMEPPKVLVVRIADPDLPFGGTWTYELSEAGGGTALRITENGEVYNPLFRFMARFVFGHEKTLATYLDALERRLVSQKR